MTEVSAVLRSATSAWASTAVVAVAVLFVVTGSLVVVVADALLVRVAPLATLAATLTMTVKVWLTPAVRLASEQLTVPLAPAVGVVQVKVGPAPWLSETKVVPVGRASLRATVAASDGPWLARLIV